MAGPRPNRTTLQTLAIVAASFVVYIPLRRAGFVWDDGHLLYASPLIHAPDGLYRFWFTTQAFEYFPIAYTTLWLEWRLWGMNAVGYHLTNVAIHATSAVLLWRILVRLDVRGAWLIGLVFAVHPVNTASVMWISERKNVLSLCFAAFSALAYLRFDDDSSRRWWILSFLSFLLALLSKTAVVGFPVVLLAFVWWRHREIRLADLWPTLPFFAASGVLSLVTIYFQYTNGIGPEMHDFVRPEGFLSRLAGVGWAVWFYLGTALWPAHLVMIYPRWEIDPARPLHWVPLVLLLGVIALARLRAGRGGRGVLFGFACLIALLLPVLGFFDIYYYRYSLVSDHWHYPAIVATLAVAIGAGATFAKKRGGAGRSIGIALATLVVVVLGTLTFGRARTFESSTTLFEHNVAVYPEVAGAYFNLGVAKSKDGKLVEAVTAYRRAIEVDPGYAEAHQNLGLLYHHTGKLRSALHHFRRAAAVRPNLAQAHYRQGQVLEELGRPEQAMLAYRRGIEVGPDEAPSRVALSLLLMDRGRIDEAREHLRVALAGAPDDPEVHFVAGRLELRAGHPHEARRHFDRTLALDPEHPGARAQLERLVPPRPTATRGPP